MQAKDSIINSILSDANSIVLEEDKKILEQIEMDNLQFNEWQDAELKKADKENELERQSVLDKRKTLSNLEGKKLILKAKSEIADSVFNMALEKLIAMDKQSTKSFINSLIANNASNGETVLISKNFNLTAEDLQSLDAFNKLNLKCNVVDKKFYGIIIEGLKYDKNLTYDAIIDDIKDKKDSFIASELFN